MSLVDELDDPERRREVAEEAVRETDRAVRAIGGLRGLTISAGLQTVHRLRPGFLASNIETLLPQWAEALDPWWEAGVQRGDPEAHLIAHADEVAEDLLAVADAHAARAGDATAKAVYDRLRPRAAMRVSDDMPRVAAFVKRTLG